MKIDVSKIPLTKQIEINEDIVFDKEKFVCHRPLIEVLSCNANVKVQKFEEFIYLTLKIKAKVILECAFTCTHFEKTLIDEDELHFAQYVDDEDDDMIAIKGNCIELNDYIFNLLSAAVPMAPMNPNAKASCSGNGYRVISDEDFYKERKEQGNSQFDCLEDLEFDD